MAKVVMLTALAGDGIDIVPGDACECSSEQAVRFLAFAYAREFRDGDESRPLKILPCAPGATAGESGVGKKKKVKNPSTKAVDPGPDAGDASEDKLPGDLPPIDLPPANSVTDTNSTKAADPVSDAGDAPGDKILGDLPSSDLPPANKVTDKKSPKAKRK